MAVSDMHKWVEVMTPGNYTPKAIFDFVDIRLAGRQSHVISGWVYFFTLPEFKLRLGDWASATMPIMYPPKSGNQTSYGKLECRRSVSGWGQADMRSRLSPPVQPRARGRH